jgi:enoyl-CoA hydratase/carnithine racemase
MARDPDHFDAETMSPLGAGFLVVLDLAEPGAEARAARLAATTQALLVGLDAAGVCPAVDPAPFDVLLTAVAHPPAPWVQATPTRLDAIRQAVAAAPIAASVLCQVLRAGEALPLRAALAVESLGYSTLLDGAAFAVWRARTPPGTVAAARPYLTVDREDDLVTVTLTRPDTRNAMSAAMRDALFEALANVLDDPSAPRLRLAGQGECFSTGGDLAEFGTARDLALAHAVRTARSCAALLAELGDRAEVVLHGACVGSGLEIPAAAARRFARPGTFFQLPELRMGLIPGAGGTVTLSRVLGRHRTAYMALSARRVALDEAVRWGLVHALR